MSAPAGTRRIRFNRWGLAEDPRHCHVMWTEQGRTVLAYVRDTYRREEPQAIMLRVTHLNGEPMPDVAASFVYLLDRDWQPSA